MWTPANIAPSHDTGLCLSSLSPLTALRSEFHLRLHYSGFAHTRNRQVCSARMITEVGTPLEQACHWQRNIFLHGHILTHYPGHRGIPLPAKRPGCTTNLFSQVPTPSQDPITPKAMAVPQRLSPMRNKPLAARIRCSGGKKTTSNRADRHDIGAHFCVILPSVFLVAGGWQEEKALCPTFKSLSFIRYLKRMKCPP